MAGAVELRGCVAIPHASALQLLFRGLRTNEGLVRFASGHNQQSVLEAKMSAAASGAERLCCKIVRSSPFLHGKPNLHQTVRGVFDGVVVEKIGGPLSFWSPQS